MKILHSRHLLLFRTLRATSIAAGLAGMVSTFPGAAWAGATTVYKCFDRNLGILYTDEPCRGEQMNIRAGDADPEAVAALQREREALSRSMSQRIVDNRRAVLERDSALQWTAPPMPVANYADDGLYYGSGYGVPGYYAGNRARGNSLPPPERRDRASYVPNPPSRGAVRR